MDDSIILRAALDRGWITPRQLGDALKAGAAGEADGFGDYLVARGWIDADRALSLRAATGTGPRAGRFLLLRELGRGGMGVVHEGWDPKLRRRVAVKILSDALADEEDVARFHHEARTAASLQHPGIVRIHEIGREGDRPFIVMDLLEGGTLSGLKLPPRRAASTLAAVARAVAEAHRRGIIHRDLKPQNVLLDADGNPCVADFGLAKRLAASSKLTATGFVVGTPNYMAPEQARGLASQVDARSDVYALGAVLFEVLTGRQAVEGKTLLDTLRRAAENEPRPPSQVAPATPRELDAIVLTAMAKDRARRYATAGAFADDLDRWLAGRPIHARIAFRWPAFLRRRPALVATAAALPVAATLAWILMSSPPPPPAPALAKAAVKPAPAKPGSRARAQPDYDAGRRLLESARLDFYRADADLGRTRARLDEAGGRFGAALVLDPAFGEAALARGHARALARRPESAHADYTLAVALLPGSAEARLARGMLSLQRVSDYAFVAGWRRSEFPPSHQALLREAESDLRRARELGLEKDATRYLEAALAYLAGDGAGAIAVLDALGGDGALREDIHRLRARAWGERAGTARTEEERARFQKAAIDDFSRAIGLCVNDADSRRLRGSLYFQADRLPEAKADFEAVLRVDPDGTFALSDMATFHYHGGRTDLAAPLLDRSIAADPGNVRARSLRGVLRLEKSDLPGARADLEAAVEANPYYLPALLNLAICLERMGESVESLRRLNEVIVRQPDLAVAFNARGVLHFKQERWKEALADLERAAALAPSKYTVQVRGPVEECRRRLNLR